MLHSPGGSGPRRTTPLSDNKRDTDVKGSRSRALAHHGPETEESSARYPREELMANRALQESAYRLHELVKRNSPQRAARSPIRFNKTEPLPRVGKPLQTPKSAMGGPATGGVGKALPSPRHSPLRRGASDDPAAGEPQTKNVVERMIAYARYAASQEDPGMVQRDRQSFVARLADHSGPGEPEAVASTSPRHAATSSSSSSYPIMSNLRMHASLRKQQAAQTAPLARERVRDEDGGALNTKHTSRLPLAKDGGLYAHRDHISDRLNNALLDPLAVDLNGLYPLLPADSQPSGTTVPPCGTVSTPSYSHSAEHDAQRAQRPQVRPASDSLRRPLSMDSAGAPSTPQRPPVHSRTGPLPMRSVPHVRPETVASPAAWSKEKWRVFLQAVHESFGASSVAARDAVDVFDDLMRRLPRDMRNMTIQEMVHRLNAWIRSTAKVAAP